MNTTSLRSRYEELKEQIHFHNHRYHVLDAPVVSDAEFDQPLNELKRIEAEHPDWGHRIRRRSAREPSLLTVSTRFATLPPF